MKQTYYIFQKNKVVNHRNNHAPLPFSHDNVQSLLQETSPVVMQAAPTDQSMVLVELDDSQELPDGYELINLRSLLGWVDDSHFLQWGKAAQLLNWYTSNKFCGRCGSATHLHANEMAMVCSSCARSNYPAISPCIIVLVHKLDKILLARSPRFRDRMFSTLAGFVEPGETAEETVQREIYEEVRIRVSNIRYYKSQPWPFPGQLMLGFFAQFEAGEIRIDGVEICEADWFHIDKLPQVPVSGTIAGQLIRHYISTR